MRQLLTGGHAVMQSFTNLLRLITRRYNLMSLIINTAAKEDINTQSAFSATEVKPSLGVAWTFSADTCVFMHRSVQEDLITVEVFRSRSGVIHLLPQYSSKESGWITLDPESFTFR
jgi:hypothetical protein